MACASDKASAALPGAWASCAIRARRFASCCSSSQLRNLALLCHAEVMALLRAQCGDEELVLGGRHLQPGRVEGLPVPLSIRSSGCQLIDRLLQHLGLRALAIRPHGRERRGEIVHIRARGCAGPSRMCVGGACKSARIRGGLRQQIDCLNGRTRGRGSLREVAAHECQVGGRRVLRGRAPGLAVGADLRPRRRVGGLPIRGGHIRV